MAGSIQQVAISDTTDVVSMSTEPPSKIDSESTGIDFAPSGNSGTITLDETEYDLSEVLHGEHDEVFNVTLGDNNSLVITSVSDPSVKLTLQYPDNVDLATLLGHKQEPEATMDDVAMPERPQAVETSNKVDSEAVTQTQSDPYDSILSRYGVQDDRIIKAFVSALQDEKLGIQNGEKLLEEFLKQVQAEPWIRPADVFSIIAAKMLANSNSGHVTSTQFNQIWNGSELNVGLAQNLVGGLASTVPEVDAAYYTYLSGSSESNVAPSTPSAVPDTSDRREVAPENTPDAANQPTPAPSETPSPETPASQPTQVTGELTAVNTDLGDLSVLNGLESEVYTETNPDIQPPLPLEEAKLLETIKRLGIVLPDGTNIADIPGLNIEFTDDILLEFGGSVVDGEVEAEGNQVFAQLQGDTLRINNILLSEGIKQLNSFNNRSPQDRKTERLYDAVAILASSSLVKGLIQQTLAQESEALGNWASLESLEVASATIASVFNDRLAGIDELDSTPGSDAQDLKALYQTAYGLLGNNHLAQQRITLPTIAASKEEFSQLATLERKALEALEQSYLDEANKLVEKGSLNDNEQKLLEVFNTLAQRVAAEGAQFDSLISKVEAMDATQYATFRQTLLTVHNGMREQFKVSD